ncbi:MAG: hypothetical protein ACRDD1_05685, partial [Planctomycetia bacterium]
MAANDPYDRPNETFDDRDLPPLPPPNKSGGCMKSCLIGCGVTALLLLVGGGIAGYLGYQTFKDSVSADPLVIAKWQQEVLPSKLPEGFAWKFGFNMNVFGNKIAILTATRPHPDDAA